MNIRRIGIVALLTLAMGTHVGKTESIDLSSMTREELIELQESIENELKEKLESSDPVTVPQGTWIVGEDIPAGRWTITYDGKLFCMISAVGCDHYDTLALGSMYGNMSGTLTLYDGQEVSVIGGDVVFEPYTGSLDF